ncbi:hypothetical protein KIPB_001558 [Kipferlia bialata]|uniref:Uncharacterized protein n=1 Tax=Kipferlia bialata TaxID=797122 RepID=A0A9K3CS59_9EUKA|nr:hypothetical protein KIPB_001558 [Kipferlia bialata]|eukprot:g1558.t1
MPPSRVAVVPFHSIAHLSPDDPTLFQPCKVILLVNESTPSHQWPLLDSIVRRSLGGRCFGLLTRRRPVMLSASRVPHVTLASLSPSPHTLSASPGCAPFVSPVFSNNMRRSILGYILTVGLRESYPVAGPSAGFETDIILELIVRQITSLACLVAPEASQLLEMYSRPLLTRSSLVPFPKYVPKGSYRLTNDWHYTREAKQASLHNTLSDVYATVWWTRQFHSLDQRLFFGRRIQRMLRGYGDIVCFQGATSLLYPLTCTIPGDCKELSIYDNRNRGSDLTRQDSFRSRAPSMSRTSMSHRSNHSFAASLNRPLGRRTVSKHKALPSICSGKQSVSGSQYTHITARSRQSTTNSAKSSAGREKRLLAMLEQTLERASASEDKDAVLTPSEDTFVKSLIPETCPLDLMAFCQDMETFHASTDPMDLVSAADYFSPLAMAPVYNRAKELHSLRAMMRGADMGAKVAQDEEGRVAAQELLGDPALYASHQFVA